MVPGGVASIWYNTPASSSKSNRGQQNLVFASKSVLHMLSTLFLLIEVTGLIGGEIGGATMVVLAEIVVFVETNVRPLNVRASC